MTDLLKDLLVDIIDGVDGAINSAFNDLIGMCFDAEYQLTTVFGELVMNVRKAVDGNLEATFKLILEFESVINQECKIDGKFNQDSKDYIVDKLILKIKKFKKI